MTASRTTPSSATGGGTRNRSATHGVGGGAAGSPASDATGVPPPYSNETGRTYRLDRLIGKGGFAFVKGTLEKVEAEEGIGARR